MSESDADRSPAPRPARNMADIARLFLDGARGGGEGVSKRIGPKDRNGGASGGTERVAPKPISAPVGSSWEMPSVMLGIGSGGKESWQLLSSMAAGLANEHSTTVCLLGMRDGQFVMEVAGSESSEDLPRVAPTAGSADVQMARVLFTLRDSIGHWVIAAPEVGTSGFAKLGTAIGQWVLACAANNEGVVAAYQQLKRAMMRGVPSMTPRCYMVSDDYAEAALVHGRLRAATSEFLRQELPLAGAGRGDEACCRVAAISVVGDAKEEDILWATVIDELCETAAVEEEIEMGELVEAAPVAQETDVESALEQVSAATEAVSAQSMHASAVFDQLAHVLDPEERAALGAELGGDEQEVESVAVPSKVASATVGRPAIMDIREQVIPPVEAPSQVRDVVPVVEERDRGVTLRAFDVLDTEESDRGTQWEAVERSVRDLVSDSILLEARPPMSWASNCCLAIDANGGLHVWTLYKDGVSWFALREWAAEHRNLLALTRRDLVLNRDGDVMVHIVLPLEPGTGKGDGAPDIRSLLRTPSRNVFLYRLRAVQWNGRRGILVVPIA